MHAPDDRTGISARLFTLYGRLLGPLLVGYLLFDRAFAYLHIPGTPLYIGEMVLAVGVLAVITSVGQLGVPRTIDPIYALLGAFILWGLVVLVSDLGTYGLLAVRDSAVWYYSIFAVTACATFVRLPGMFEKFAVQLERLTPWILIWLTVALLLTPVADEAPNMPFTTVSILSHKPGNAAIAALLCLGSLWLLSDHRSARYRATWSILALLVLALSATQNRGGMLAAAAGSLIGLAHLKNPLRLVRNATLTMVVFLGFAILMLPQQDFSGIQGRSFSASQLIDNVASFGGADSPGNLGGTIDGRVELWARIVEKQEAEGRFLDGTGFGVNLAERVGVYDGGRATLRSPHNSHLHILARMGLVGLSLWIILLVAWYSRLLSSCRRWGRQPGIRRPTVVCCLAMVTAVLVSTFFDPQLEGPQIAALFWTAFGIGLAVTCADSPIAGRLGLPQGFPPSSLAPPDRWKP